MMISTIIDTPQARIMDAITDPVKQYTVSELVDKTCLSRPTVYKILYDLELQNLVEKHGMRPLMFKANRENYMMDAFIRIIRCEDASGIKTNTDKKT